MPENRASSKDALEEVYISTTGSLGKLCLTFNAKTATDGSRLRRTYILLTIYRYIISTLYFKHNNN